MLDEFRSTRITWDKATSRIYSPVTANASDENGRKLVVQIVNSGQVEDLTGATLHLYWETRDKAHDGLDVFDAVDLEKGEFELSYTTGMLSNQGVLNANLVLIDTVGRVVSERFKITVTEGIDDDAIQSSDSFSSLTQALIDISNLEQNYAPRLNDLTAQLADTDSELNKKVGSGTLAEMGDLSQSVKEAMTGGSVAVVGEGAVAEVNLANDVKSEISKIQTKENIILSQKNMFNPNEVIHGRYYRNDGALATNSGYMASPKYTVSPGEIISISNIQGISRGNTLFGGVRLWLDNTFVQSITVPTFTGTNYMTFTVPDGVNQFGFAMISIPPSLQIEKAPQPTKYEPYRILENGVAKKELETLLLQKSNKNLYDGVFVKEHRVFRDTISSGQHANDAITSFVPVEFGKYYTISGLMPQKVGEQSNHIKGFSSNHSVSSGFVKNLGYVTSDTVAVYIDDPNIKFIILPITNDYFGGTQEDIEKNAIQVEEGQVATPYEPHYFMPDVKKLTDVSAKSLKSQLEKSEPDIITSFLEVNKVRRASELATITKDFSPFGIGFEVTGETHLDSVSNNLFVQYKPSSIGSKEVFVNVANFVSGSIAKGKMKPIHFTVPSGQLDNEEPIPNFNERFHKDDYTHPSIAYDATGVAGYKYWMIASVYPLGVGSVGGATWEDEDLFVSNDANNWTRVKSLYENDKTYTTTTLSLPPHSLATGNARKHAFLPSPATGEQIEISVPADNGAPALDREIITLVSNPWKHDPAILIDGGYVYTYHSFHLPYADRTGGKNRFVVCVRTNDGINWEVVRSDGSTMLLTEETSRQLFTKDEQGRYNYLYYGYNRVYSNPEVIKYGDNDYEFVYGYNFTRRFKGSTPYNFDFTTPYPMQDVGSGNHPALLVDGTKLYLLNNNNMFVSEDRGVTFTKYNKYPAWVGGIGGIPYKKALCTGENGKVILVETQRQILNSPSKAGVNGFVGTQSAHQMYIYEYANVNELVGLAQSGLVDGYVDLQLAKINYDNSRRDVRLYPYLSNTTTTILNNSPLQRLKVADINVEEGDTIYLYVTLNSRNGATIQFGGIEVV